MLNLTDNKASRGAVMVDAAVTLPFLLMSIFTALTIIFYLHQKLCLFEAMEKTLRWSITGKTLPGSTREASIRTLLVNNAKSLGVNVDPATISICPIATAGDCPAGSNN